MNDGRRNFLKLSAAATLVPLQASAEPERDDCQFHADNLARAMGELHGHPYVATIRSDLKSVYITRLS